jgi:methylglutaconyl-CoA hydratase
VIKAIGQRHAQRYFLTAETFNTKEAQRIGLIHMVANPDQIDHEVEKICKQLLMNSPQAMQAAKQLIQEIAVAPLDENLMEMTANKIAAIRASKEAQEGLQAFLEKRKPQWIKE